MSDLDDLAERLAEKAVILEKVARSHPDPLDRTRLRGMAEGVLLALSFVNEYQRAT